MKIVFYDNKKYLLRWVYIISAIFILGVVTGAVYISLLSDDLSIGVGRYLNSYFKEIITKGDYTEIFKNSVLEYLKIFLILFFCALSKPTAAVCCVIPLLKGFFCGFTTASLIKFYGIKGLGLSVSLVPAALISVPVLIFYSSACFIGANNRIRVDRKKMVHFFVLSICCLTIFCVAAFLDTFATTTFMKFLYSVLGVN